MIELINEYYVLNALSKGGWMTADEIAPSAEWGDGWEAHRMMETLENEKLVKSTFSQDNVAPFHITQSGEYRLHQLRERREYESKTIALLDELNSKLDRERDGRIANSEEAAKESIKRKRIERIEFWATFIATLIGSVAAVGSLMPLSF